MFEVSGAAHRPPLKTPVLVRPGAARQAPPQNAPSRSRRGGGRPIKPASLIAADGRPPPDSADDIAKASPATFVVRVDRPNPPKDTARHGEGGPSQRAPPQAPLKKHYRGATGALV